MKHVKTVVGVIVAVAAVLFGYGEVRDSNPASHNQPASNSASAPSAQDYADASERIVAAFKAQQGDLWIEGGGTVQRVLADDSEGSRHQRFIIRLDNDHTVLIAHNIDLAQRVPVRPGDAISFYGEYEYNDRGGVVHWTHHDPRNRREGGWIRHKGTTYR